MDDLGDAALSEAVLRGQLFLARDLSEGSVNPDLDEVISIQRVALGEALLKISSGEIIDAKTIVALYRAREFLGNGSGPLPFREAAGG